MRLRWSPRVRHRLGSTLAEVMVSLVIFGMVVSGLIYGYVQVNRMAEFSSMSLAAQTTVNAAMLCGIVASDPTKTGNVGYNGDCSGGVENFLRLLENWGSSTLTCNGSIVVLFYSQYATNSWVQTGKYYSAPTRHWAFDLNFQQANKLPPLTPQIRAMIRGNWYAHR